MNVGRMKHLVTVLRPDYVNAVVDEYSRKTVPWVQYAELYADVADVSGREFYEAAAHQLQDTVTFTTRWTPGILKDMRIQWNGVTYSIDQVNHLGYRMDFMRIKAHAIESEGTEHGTF